MRISEEQISSIKTSVAMFISDYELYLFGSRTDDTKKGGDLDLMILTPETTSLELKWNIKREIKKLIGEQRIDLLIFNKEQNELFKDIILDGAVKL